VCLCSEFFDTRERVQRACEARGEQELDAFLRAHRISFERVLQARLLEFRGTMSTAELSSFTLARSGRFLLREDRSCQLVFVRRTRQAALLQALRAVRGPMRLLPRSSRPKAQLQVP
jgi:hypothetical protein